MYFKKLNQKDLKTGLLSNLVGAPVENFTKSTTELNKYSSTFTTGLISFEQEEKKDNLNKQAMSQSSAQGQNYLLPIVVDRHLSAEIKHPLDDSIDNKSERIEVSSNNWLIVKNPSNMEEIRNLNIKLGLKNEIQNFHVESIPASQNKLFDLNKMEGKFSEIFGEIKSKNESGIPIDIIEKISNSGYLSKDSEAMRPYLLSSTSNILYYSIFIENTINLPLENLSIVKYMPNTFIRMEFSSVSTGSAKLEKKKLLWQIPYLRPNQTAELRFQILVRPEASSSGEIQMHWDVNIDSEVEGNVSKTFDNSLKMVEMGLKTVKFLDLHEEDERPNYWQCQFDVLNRSDFKYKITSAHLYQIVENSETKKEETKLIGELNEPITIPSFTQKTLLEVSIENNKRPNLLSEYECEPIVDFKTHISGSLTLKDIKLNVLDLRFTKTFEKSVIDSFVYSTVPIEFQIENLGTVGLSQFVIVEKLPEDFEVEDKSNLTITLPQKELSYTLEDVLISDLRKTYENLDSKLQHINEKIEKLNERKREIEDKFDKLEKSKEIDSDQSENLQEKIKKASEDLEKAKKEFTELKNKINDFDKNIEEKMNRKSLLEKELTSLKKLLKKMEQYDNLKQKETSLQEELEKTKTRSTENQEQKEEKEKEIEKINKKLQKIKTQITENKKEIDELKQLLPNQTKEKIKNYQDIEKQINQTQQELMNRNKAIEEHSNEKSNINKILKEKESQIEALTNKKADLEIKFRYLKSLEQQRKELSEELEKIDKENSEENKIREQIIQEIDFISLLSKPISSLDDFSTVLLRDLDNKLPEFIKEKELFGFIQGNKKTSTYFVLIIPDITKINAPLQPGEMMKIGYSIKNEKPNPKNDYRFSSHLFYKTLEHKGAPLSVEIPITNQPRLQIRHERRNVTLGKIVDAYIEHGKYLINLIIRNKDATPIEKLTIMDFIPRNGELLHSNYEYQLNPNAEYPLQPEPLPVIEIKWELKELGPYQEIQVSYMLQVSEKDSNKKEDLTSLLDRLNLQIKF